MTSSKDKTLLKWAADFRRKVMKRYGVQTMPTPPSPNDLMRLTRGINDSLKMIGTP